jgi:hypothetical protein
MKARSIKGDSPGQIHAAVQGILGEGFKPTLAIVFISIKQDRRAVCEILRQQDIDVIGATSCTEFIDGYQSEGQIVVLLFDLAKTDFRILFEDIGERPLSDAATQLAQTALQKFSNPSLIICSTSMTASGTMLDGETLIRSMEKVVGPHIKMFGGMAGDDMSFSGTYVFTAEQTTGYGIAALVFNGDRIDMYGVALSGWKPLGLTKKITKSKKNLLYEIDGRPALEMYLRFLGEDFPSVDDQAKFFDSVGLHYPLQIERYEREPMMCNPMGYNKEENALVLESDIEEGSSFRFSTPPDFSIVETVVEKAKQIKDNEGKDADAVLIFSCASRLSALGPMAQQENDGLAAVWNAPMAGFYTYGEFGRALNGKHEFHSTTCSWVALKEK